MVACRHRRDVLIENFLDSPPLFHRSSPSMSHDFPISMTSSFAFLGHSILCANLLPGFKFQILFMCQRALIGMPVLLTHNIRVLMSEWGFFFC